MTSRADPGMRRSPTGTTRRHATRFVRSACIPTLLAAVLAGPGTAQQVRVEPRGSAVGIGIEVPWPSSLRTRTGSGAAADSALARAAASVAGELAGWSAVAAMAIECEAHALRLSFAVTIENWRPALLTLARGLDHAARDARPAASREPDDDSRGLANPSLEFSALLRRARRPDALAAPPCDLVSYGAPSSTVLGDDPTRRPPDRVRARVALYGPVDSASASALLDSLFEAPPRPLGRTAAGAPAPRRLTLERSTVSAWIGVAHPVRDPVPAESNHLLAFRLGEQLRARIGREALFDVQAVVVHGDGVDWLELRMLVDAGAAPGVERAAREALATTSVWALASEDFEALRERFRGARLHRLATPEQRALEALLNPTFAAGELSLAIDRLQSADLQTAARALGPPSVARVGPREALDPSRRSP